MYIVSLVEIVTGFPGHWTVSRQYSLDTGRFWALWMLKKLTVLINVH